MTSVIVSPKAVRFIDIFAVVLLNDCFVSSMPYFNCCFR